MKKHHANRTFEDHELENERVDVLCQCGWGLLSIKVEDVPQHCPLCGYLLNRWEWVERAECEDWEPVVEHAERVA
jgi:hypothetical protein